MWKPMIHCYQLLWTTKLLLQWYRKQKTHDWEWETLRLFWQLPLPCPSPREETVQTGCCHRESLKPVITMLKWNSSQLMAFGGKGISYLLEVSHWEFDNVPMSMWASKLDLVGLFFSLQGRHKGERANLRGMGGKCDGVHCVTFPNN